MLSFFSKLQNRKLIKQSRIFDLEYYKQQTKVNFKNENAAIWHFLGQDTINPSPLFDAHYYSSANAEVKKSKINPLVHFIKYGWKETRNPHELFDTKFYVEQNPDIKARQLNPLTHYIHYGAAEGRNPHPLFDTKFYFEHSPDVKAANLNPLAHYIRYGALEGRDPNRFFDSLWYSKKHCGEGKNKSHPLIHFVSEGAVKNYDPSIFFQTDWYSAQNPDIKDLLPFYHFMQIGEAEGRLPYEGYKPDLDGRNLITRHFHCVIEMAKEYEKLNPFKSNLMLSLIVPVYNTPQNYLNDLLASFQIQGKNCELILSDDGSTSIETIDWLKAHEQEPQIIVVWNSKNSGIAAASNAGLAKAQGNFIGLVDHDDALTPFAVLRIIRALEAAPQCQFLYTDEILADGNLKPVEYYLKPAWDIALLSGVNYINHLSVYNRKRLQDMGGFREGFQGSQDYDLVLRYTKNLQPNEILHLPYPAYIWRRDGQSYSVKFLKTATDNARRAIAERYNQPVVEAAPPSDLHRIRFDSQIKNWPLISVVIPNRNSLEHITCVLDGLTTKTDYPNMEIIIIDNGSTDAKVLALYETYRKGKVAFEANVEVSEFNFSRSVNDGIKKAKGEHMLLLNNDIEIIESGWLKEMVSCFAYENTGIVGAKLLYPDETIQHAGVIVGLGQLAGHWYSSKERNHPGKMGRLWVRQSMSAVTGACMLISKACIDKIGLLDEVKFKVAYNDIDYCLRAMKAGFRVVWTPFAELIHHESVSRGSDYKPENIARFECEKDNLKEAHGTKTYCDPALNPWYSKDNSEPTFMMLDELPQAR